MSYFQHHGHGTLLFHQDSQGKWRNGNEVQTLFAAQVGYTPSSVSPKPECEKGQVSSH